MYSHFSDEELQAVSLVHDLSALQPLFAEYTKVRPAAGVCRVHQGVRPLAFQALCILSIQQGALLLASTQARCCICVRNMDHCTHLGLLLHAFWASSRPGGEEGGGACGTARVYKVHPRGWGSPLHHIGQPGGLGWNASPSPPCPCPNRPDPPPLHPCFNQPLPLPQLPRRTSLPLPKPPPPTTSSPQPQPALAPLPSPPLQLQTKLEDLLEAAQYRQECGKKWRRPRKLLLMPLYGRWGRHVYGPGLFRRVDLLDFYVARWGGLGLGEGGLWTCVDLLALHMARWGGVYGWGCRPCRGPWLLPGQVVDCATATEAGGPLPVSRAGCWS